MVLFKTSQTRSLLLYSVSIIILLTFFLKVNAAASESLFYKEINLIGGYSNIDHWVGKSSTLANSIGFEYYKKFSNEYGDYMTGDLQMRASYDSKKNSHEAWGLEIHNAWLEYKLGYVTKIRAGHFDPSFGLEPVLDTHGTILQTLAMNDIGFTKDWGISLRGSLPKFDYESSLQLGSGMSIRRKDGSFLATTRIGSPSSENLQYGFSLLYGKVLETDGMRTFPKNELLSDEATDKKRVGIDGQYLFGPYLFKGEVAYGTNDKDRVLGYLTEIDYTLPKYQNCQFELQFQSWINDLNESSSDLSTLTAGVSYKLTQNKTLRATFSHDFSNDGEKEEDKFLLQFYYFGL
ncbi:MAG: hypothetical protein PHH69_02110 [Candidatus Omnitrophica bacterium]|nr:hypothetical protein [Candidatus Omnitrophota bacterium]MDD5610324.1 hypothetical protein [Candidatus Omnitrophota bacterium]